MLPHTPPGTNHGQDQAGSSDHDQGTAQPGDLLELNPTAAADAVRSRAIAGSVVGFEGVGSPWRGLVNLECQLGRDEVRGSVAGAGVASAADLEAASWRDYINPSKGLGMTHSSGARVIRFDKQLSRFAARANAAAEPEQQQGLETGDLDGGVYQPRPAAAVWPAAAAAGFGSAARGTAAAAAARPHVAATVAVDDAAQALLSQKQGQSAGGTAGSVQQAARSAGAGETGAEGGAKQHCRLQLSSPSRLQLLKRYNRRKERTKHTVKEQL